MFTGHGRRPAPLSAAALWLLASAVALTPAAAGQDAPPGRPERAAEPAPRRPNVIVVLADDLGIGDPGCYNPASKVPTPHVDRLAREGLRLTDAHTPSAVCTPTRYGLLTGRYAWRTWLTRGVLWGGSPSLIEPDRSTLADLLSERGWRTAVIGKWHLGLGEPDESGAIDWSRPLRPSPLDHGFDTFFGIPASLDMPPYVYVLDDRPVQAAEEVALGSAPRRDGGGGYWRAGAIARDFRHAEVLPRLSSRAVEWIERSRREQPERPFFLYLALSAPHTPWLPSAAWEGRSGCGPYGDFAAQVDGVLGEVLAALDRLELTDDTIVVFTSDNGAHWRPSDIEQWEHAANLDWRGQKADIWEAGHRVPFVLRWPGRVPAGAVRDEPFCLTDLYATLATWTGDSLAPGGELAEDSFDQSLLLEGAELSEPLRPHLIHHSLNGHFALRRGPWKLIPRLGSGGFSEPREELPVEGGPAGQLYHLERDPRETTNLYLEQPEVVAELTALLGELAAAGRTRP